MILSYPKVFNIGNPEIADIFSSPVLVEEKIDGSQFSFGWNMETGKLECRSHHKEIDLDVPDSLFSEGVRVVKELSDILRSGWTYRGEYLKKPKHNTLAYDRIPQNYIIIFDIQDEFGRFLPSSEKAEEAKRLGLEIVPSFGYLSNPSVDDFHHLLEKISILGGQTVEGVVFKNYDRVSERTGHILMGKYVSDAFREKNKSNWKEQNPGQGDILQKIGDAYKTPARWEKSIIHLKERGELLNDPKDIGPLLKEISKDLLEECAEEIKKSLFSWAWKKISREVTKGFPEWYKERLLEEALKK